MLHPTFFILYELCGYGTMNTDFHPTVCYVGLGCDDWWHLFNFNYKTWFADVSFNQKKIDHKNDDHDNDDYYTDNDYA